MLEGCYDCLLEARATYEQIAVGRARPPVLQRLFEVEMLIALREKELALEAEPPLARARALAKDLPAALEADRYLEIVEAVPWDAVGSSKREGDVFLREPHAMAQRVDDLLKWLEAGALSQPVRQYLALALGCGYPIRPGQSGQLRLREKPHEAPPGAPPLIAYRTGICADLNREILERVRNDVPRFVETSLFLGRLELSFVAVNGGARARALFTEAYARFPKSPAVTYLNGSLHQAAGDCRAAVRYYDETLALKSAHEDALLGRTICLSLLKESDGAITTATRLIELGTYNQGDAYYWRAWNRHRRKELGQARADSDRAKTLLYNSGVLTLAGMIEHDQDDLSAAEKDLMSAKDLDDQNCTAIWFFALVDLRREQWPHGANHFVEAMTCYDAAARNTEQRMQVILRRQDLESDFKARQIAGFEGAIKEDRSQESAAAYNAAANFLRAGDATRAATYAVLAARDPDRLGAVEELRKLIKQVIK